MQSEWKMGRKIIRNEQFIVSGITYSNTPDGLSKRSLFALAFSNKERKKERKKKSK